MIGLARTVQAQKNLADQVHVLNSQYDELAIAPEIAAGSVLGPCESEDFSRKRARRAVWWNIFAKRT